MPIGTADMKDAMAGKFDQAIDILKQLVNEHRDCGVCWLGMGCSDQRKHPAEAEKYASKALSAATTIRSGPRLKTEGLTALSHSEL